MSDVILHWLNKEIILAKAVENIEKDFANGYLLGQLCFKLGWIETTIKLVDKNNSGSVQTNFSEIKECLRDYGLLVNPKVLDNIKSETRGSALKVLHQIRLISQKSREKRKYEQSMVVKTVKDSILGSLTEEKSMLKGKGGQALNPKQLTTIKMQEHLEHFPNEKKKQIRQLYKEHKETEELHKTLLKDQRKIRLEAMMTNKQFMDEWQGKGRENWASNQRRLYLQRKKVENFEQSEVNKFMRNIERYKNNAGGEANSAMEEFVRNLERLGIDINAVDLNVGQTKKKEAVSAVAIMGRIRDKRATNEFARKEKQRRNRKMAVEETKTQSEIEKRVEEEKLILRLWEQSLQYRNSADRKKKITDCNRYDEEHRFGISRKFGVNRKSELEKVMKDTSNFYEEKKDERKEYFIEQGKLLHRQERSHKEGKQEIHKQLLEDMMSSILELTNEAFKKQIHSESQQIEGKQWKKWMNLFVEGESVTAFSTFYSPKKEKKQKGEESEVEKAYVRSANYDILDYMNHMGIWTTSSLLQMVSESLHMAEREGLEMGVKSIEEMQEVKNNYMLAHIKTEMETQIPATWDDGQVQPLVLHQYDESSHLQHGETGKVLVPMETGRSGIINTVTVNNTVTVPPQIPQIPLYHAYKIVILGGALVGKSYQSDRIARKYKLKVFEMEKMVREAIQLIVPSKEVNEEEAVHTSQAAAGKGKKGGRPPPKKKESSPDIDKNLNVYDTPQIREIGEKLNKGKEEGEGIEDITYATLFIEYLKAAFEMKTVSERKQLIKEKVRRREEIRLEMEQVKEDLDNKAKNKQAAKREQELIGELEGLEGREEMGWILEGFPCTLRQAELLEEGLTGFKKKEPGSRNKEGANILSIPISDIFSPTGPIRIPPPPPRELTPEKNEGEQKWWGMTKGRPKTIKKQKTVNTEQVNVIQKSFTAVESTGLGMLLWLSGTLSQGVHRVNNMRTDPDTGAIYNLNLTQVDDPKVRDRLVQGEQPDIMALKSRNEEFEGHQEELIKWFRQFGDVGHKFEVLRSVDAGLPCEQIDAEVDAHLEALGKINELKEEILIREIEEEIQRENTADDFERADSKDIRGKEKEEPVPVPALHKGSQSQLAKSSSKVMFNRKISTKPMHSLTPSQISPGNTMLQSAEMSSIGLVPQEKLIKHWNKMTDDYIDAFRGIFKYTRKHKDLINQGLADMHAEFVKYQNRSEDKQKLVDDFITKYLELIHDYPKLQTDPVTKENLCEKIDELNDDLWDMIELRKDESLAELERIQNSKWIKHEIAQGVENIHCLMQAEANRHIQTCYFIISYHHIIHKQTVPRKFVEFVLALEELESITSPLHEIQKLHSSACEYVDNTIFNVGTFEPLTENLDDISELCVEAINTSRESTLFRLEMLQYWGVAQVNDIVRVRDSVFEMLNEWITMTVTTENTLANQVVDLLKQKVNHHLKLHYDIKIKPVGLEFKEDTMDMSDLAKGSYMEGKLEYDLSELEALRVELDKLSYDAWITVDALVHLIVNKKLNGTLSPLFQTFSLSQFFMIKTNSTKVNWKEMLLYLALGSITQPQFQELYQYTAALKDNANENHDITLTNFLAVEFWFEEKIISNDPEQIIQLKTLIFELFKKYENVMSVITYTNALKGDNWIKTGKEDVRYFDLLFTP